MKTVIALLSVLFITRAIAADAPTASAASLPLHGNSHRFLIVRTFPEGALEGLDAATKQKVNANNASVGVRWVQSYANADKTKTYCVYEGPSEAAVRQAATLNALPVDSVTEVPVDLDPGSKPGASAAAVEKHRFLIERTFAPDALAHLDAAGKQKINATNAEFGVNWITSYANASETKTFCIYEGPNAQAVRDAARANGISVDSVTEVPVTLLPN